MRLPALVSAAGFLAAGTLMGCDQGWASLPWKALTPRTSGSSPTPRSPPTAGPGSGTASLLRGTDCSDGLARCEDGRVWVSRLATLPATCDGASAPCVCPWDSIAACLGGCAAEGAVAVMERAKAAVQMCAPAGRGGGPTGEPPAGPGLVPPPSFQRSLPAPSFVRPFSADSQSPSDCDDDDAYRCSDSVVVDCGLERSSFERNSRTTEGPTQVGSGRARSIARCSSGCSTPGGTLFGDGIDRESAFAILCSR